MQTGASEKIIKQGKEENLELRWSLTSLETEFKVLKKAFIEKEKDNHDLRKENKPKEDTLFFFYKNNFIRTSSLRFWWNLKNIKMLNYLILGICS